MAANTPLVIIPADTYTAPVTTAPITTGFKNARFFLNITAITGADHRVLGALEVQDPASGNWVTLNPSFLNSNVVGTTQFTFIDSTLTPVGTFRLVLTPYLNTSSVTFSVGAVLFD